MKLKGSLREEREIKAIGIIYGKTGTILWETCGTKQLQTD